jgi:hypothetical protein
LSNIHIDYNAEKSKEIYISKVGFNRKENKSLIFNFTESIELNLVFENNLETQEINFGVSVKNYLGQKIFTSVLSDNKIESKTKANYTFKIPPSLLLNGIYSIDVAVFNNFILWEYIKDVCNFEIIDHESPASAYNNSNIGNVNVQCTWIKID